MALSDCSIIRDEILDCADNRGGIKEVLVIEFENVPQANITSASGTVTVLNQTSGTKFVIIGLDEGVAELTEAENRSVENGTLFYETTLNLFIKKLSAASRNNLNKMAQNRLMIVIRDANDTYWLMGQTRAAYKTGTNEAKTGKAMGDANGYNVTFMAREPEPLNVVASDQIAGLTNLA